ncbi:SRPBCC family protein [Burkholderia cepacia]|uniref:SRPBCC family protein n=1 Tax=Burkholderia cepacia TaxID=292 RepID=UPI003D665CFD
MFSYAASVEVNPPGTEVVLSHEQLWRALELKAENPVAFVPGMETCKVVERFDDGFLREAVLRGKPLIERITYTAPVMVHFERKNSVGWITNIISESARGLVLTFCFSVTFPDVEPGSSDEQERGARMSKSYMQAVETTLAESRRRAVAHAL